MRKLWLLGCLNVLGVALGQAPTSCIQDTLVIAPGATPVQLGTIQISWPQFNYGIYTVAPGQLTYTVNNGLVGGSVTPLCLVPTDHASSFVAYSAHITTGPGVQAIQTYWKIPTNGGPFTLNQVTVNYTPGLNVNINPTQLTTVGGAAGYALTLNSSLIPTWLPEAGGITYCPAGVCNSTGSAWGTSYAVGTGANNLVQLNGSSQLPAVSAALLTNFPNVPTATQLNSACGTNQYTNGQACSQPSTTTLSDGTYVVLNNASSTLTGPAYSFSPGTAGTLTEQNTNVSFTGGSLSGYTVGSGWSGATGSGTCGASGASGCASFTPSAGTLKYVLPYSGATSGQVFSILSGPTVSKSGGTGTATLDVLSSAATSGSLFCNFFGPTSFSATGTFPVVQGFFQCESIGANGSGNIVLTYTPPTYTGAISHFYVELITALPQPGNLQLGGNGFSAYDGSNLFIGAGLNNYAQAYTGAEITLNPTGNVGIGTAFPSMYAYALPGYGSGGLYNIAIGTGALSSIINASANIGIGQNAGSNITAAYGNVAICSFGCFFPNATGHNQVNINNELQCFGGVTLANSSSPVGICGSAGDIGLGAAPAITGCSSSIGSGATNTAGFFTSGSSAACTFQLTWSSSMTYTTGVVCDYHDMTTPADVVNQTAYSQTTVTAIGTVSSGDVIVYKCRGF